MTPSATPTADPLAGWTLEEEVGQIMMVGVKTSVPQQSSHDVVASAHVGNVFLQGRADGFTAADVTSHADAFTNGLATAGVAVAPKHFPGFGRVTGNTDSTAQVVDEVTDASSDQVSVFRQEIASGARFVTVGTAEYARLDPGTPAAFSSKIVDGLLRGQLGFRGVVITDDLSAAAQVAAWSPGERAVKAVEAGCDVVLASKDPSVLPAMVQALVDKARADPAFAAVVEQAARRVLAAKGVA